MEIPSYFRRYLKAIQPSKSSRELAAQLHRTLRERVRQSPDLAPWKPDSFLYGSYRRNTAIKNIKDVDVCIVFDPSIREKTPADVINALRKALENSKYEAKTALQRRSIRIDMSNTTLDAVPVAPLVEDGDALFIPDRKLGQWITTYPKDHLAAVTAKNKACNGRLVPLIKIVKAWYKFQRGDSMRPKPKGFTLEAMVIQHHDPDAPSYAEAFITFLENLDNSSGHLLALGVFPNVPDPGRDGQQIKLTISDDETRRFGRIVRNSLKGAKEAMELTDLAESAEAWHKVFGDDFPMKPASNLVKMAQSAYPEDEEDLSAEEERDITEVDFTPSLLPVLHIRARLAKEESGPIYAAYPNDGWPLRKNLHICFELTNPPIVDGAQIRWIVVNHGKDAGDDKGHITFPGTTIHWERTAYRGSHLMICEVVRKDSVIARGQFTVNIQS